MLPSLCVALPKIFEIHLKLYRLHEYEKLLVCARAHIVTVRDLLRFPMLCGELESTT